MSHNRDGFCRNNNLPADRELDEMIYPERWKPIDPSTVPWTAGEPYEKWHEKVEEVANARDAAHELRDRQFHMELDNVLGTHTGPPRTVGQTSSEEDY